MERAVNNNMINNYFRFMRNWDIDTKKDMIVKLTLSIDEKMDSKHDFSTSFGAWSDNRSAQEIIDDLKLNRTNNHEIEAF